MSFMELLHGANTQWKSLGEIGKFQRGKRFVKSDMISKGVPCIHYGEMYTHYGIWAIQSKSYVSEELVEKKNLRVAEKGDVVMVAAGETIEDIGKGTAWLGDEGVVIHDACFSFRSALLPKYLAYFTYTRHFHDQIRRHISSGKISAINEKGLSKVEIPIPFPNNPEKSLKVQQEIVRILDRLTELTAELTAELAAELAARKKQYSYYCDRLLDFEEADVEWKSLGEIGGFSYGYAARAKDSGSARFIRISDINNDGKLKSNNAKYVDLTTSNNQYVLAKNDLLMARTGATYGKTMIFEEDYPAIYAGFLIKLKLDRELVNPRYYWHFAQSNLFWDQANKLVSGGGQPQFNANALKQVKLPVPFSTNPEKSLRFQSDIVDALDRFDTLSESTTKELQTEIDLRQKQYEYYRDALLAFPKEDLKE